MSEFQTTTVGELRAGDELISGYKVVHVFRTGSGSVEVMAHGKASSEAPEPSAFVRTWQSDDSCVVKRSGSTYRPHAPITEAGCYLDGSRGHYATRDVVEHARALGFIVDDFALFALRRYDSSYVRVSYPSDALHSLADEAVEWLNCGDFAPKGQNLPPIIPDGYSWGWDDGDFGLWADETDD